MWKIKILLLVASLAFASTQDIVLECDFNDYWTGYQCLLANITVLDPQANIVITGTHLENRTNDDVSTVLIYDSNTPFVIQQLFTEFPNIIELDIYTSNLQSISIPPHVKLQYLELTYNNISRIENGSLRNQTELLYFTASYANIEVIEDDAFEDLHSLNSLVLIGNRVQSLTSRVLAPLVSATRIDFEGNLLTNIPEDLFANNHNVEYLFLEYNQINEIHPRALAYVQDSLQHINLAGNLCASRSFSFYSDSDTEWILLNNLLQQCFNNYIGNPGDVKNLVMQFTGSLTIMDQFGNIIARL